MKKLISTVLSLAFAAMVQSVIAQPTAIKILPTGPVGARVTVEGDDAGAYLLKFGPMADQLTRSVNLADGTDLGDGATAFEFDGLSAGTLYYAQLFSSDGETAFGDVKPFVTTADPVVDTSKNGLIILNHTWASWDAALDPLRNGDPTYRYWDPRMFFAGAAGAADSQFDWNHGFNFGAACTTAFGGYAYFVAGVPYTFTIDSYIKTYQIDVDGVTFYSDRNDFPNSAPESHTHVFSESRWYEIRFITGGPEGYSEYTSENGLTISVDGGATKAPYKDPRDGSVFRITGDEKLSFAFINSTDSKINAAINIDPSLEGSTLYACFAADYGVNSLGSWTTEEITAIVEGQTVGAYSVDIPDGMRYFRLAAVNGDTVTWSLTKAIDDIEIVSGGALMAKITSTDVLSKTSVGVEFDYYGDGDSSSAYDFELDYGIAADDLKWTVTLDSEVSALGHKIYAVDGLTPGRTYYARLYGVKEGTRIPIGDQFSFTVLSETSVTLFAYAGLWEAKKASASVTDIDPMAIDIGTGEYYRHRELGMPAFANPSWISPIDGSENTWPLTEGSRGWVSCEFAYCGYMFMYAGRQYTFRVASMAANNYVKIDDGELWGIWIGNDPVPDYGWFSNVYTCRETGWHKIMTIGANGMTLLSTQPSYAGFEFSDDGSQTWKPFVDPGDGTLLRIDITPPLAADSVKIVAGKLRATAIMDEKLEGAELYVCFSDEYGGNEFDSWSDPVKLPNAIGVGETMRSVSAEIPETARYYRLAAVLNDEIVWSDPVVLAELPVIAEEKVSAEFVSLGAIGENTAVMNLNVSVPESVGDTCDIVFTIRHVGGEGAFTRTVRDVSSGVSQITIEGLCPDRDYLVSFHPASGDSIGDESEPLAVSTQGTAMLPSYAGIWQGRGTAWDRHWYQDIMGLEIGTETSQRCRQLGPMPVFDRWLGGIPYTWDNPFDPGTKSSWSGEYYFVYQGYIYLEAGDYSFNYCIDCGAGLWIDDAVVFQTADYLEHTVPYTCSCTGWHTFHFETFNEDYWGGAAGGLAKEDSFRFSYKGGAWRQMLDPGDGSLFRVKPGFRVECSAKDGRLTVRPDYNGTDSLKLAYGAADGVDFPGSWEGSVDVELTEGAFTFDYSALGQGMAKVFAVNELGEYTAESELIILPEPKQPSLGKVVGSGENGGSVEVTANAVSLGGDVATARLYIAGNADLSDAEMGEAAILTECGVFELSATSFAGAPIEPDAEFFYWVTLATEAGDEDVSPIAKVKIAGVSELGSSMSASSSSWNGSFHGEVAKLGAGDTTIYLLTGADANSLTNTASQIVTGIGEFVFNVEFPFVNETVAYAFVISNGMGSVGYSTQGAVSSLELVDAETYYWNPAVRDGQWNDAANWVSATGGDLDYRCTWPKTGQNAVRFDLVTEPTTVTIAGDWTANSIAAGNAEAKVKFVFNSTHPSISQALLTSFTDDASQTEFCLNISKEQGSDYCFEQINSVYDFMTLFVNVPKAFRLSVSPESTARKGGSHDFAVLGWGYGIDPTKVEFANRGGVEFYFVYDGGGREPRYDGDKPTQIRVSIVNAGMAVYVR